ncbi:MAG: hypothetical protein N3A54_03530 [Patescibacteria group bacterium]|nr:hypothetical protein [Patescibacteria group bacterium]
MIKKTLLLLLWFPTSSLILVANLLLIYSIEKRKNLNLEANYFISPLATMGAYHLNASDNTSKVLGASIIAADARGKILEKFLEKYDSPLTPYAYKIVEEADKNGIDFRLIVAIAMCESNLGKRMPPNSYNAWGIAIYTGMQSGKVFQDWDHAITWVSKYIRERYLEKGYDTLREIGAIYAPPSVEKGHSWSRCVETFINSIY